MLQISFMTLFQEKEGNMLEFVASPIQLFHWQLKHKLPMLIRRKEAKGYGTKKLIEGYFQEGENCLIVDDVVTSGSSIVETVQALQNVGVAVTDAVVLLDREQGGRQNLQSRGINLFSVCTLSSILTVLHSLQKISTNTVSSVRNFLKETKMLNPSSGDVETAKGWSFAKRARFCSHPLTRKLFQIMEEKKTNLVLSADLSQCQQILDIVEKVGPCICAVKTHVDILEDFTPDFTGKLGKLADKYRFVIFEDRKFADIGNTVRQQFSGGLYRISEWADIVSAHAVPGDGVVRGLKQVGLENGRGCLLVAEMSSARNLATGGYTKATVKMAEENKDFVIGFICRKKLTADPTFLHMTPGVQLSDGTDDLGQKYLTPATAIFEQESDVIIVGRGILQSDDPSKKAKQFQETAFAAYQKKLARIEEI